MAILRFVTSLLVAGFGALTPLCADARESTETSATIPLLQLVGASEADTAQQLGPASRCEPSKYGRKCFYKNEAVEIMFINGAADWFTLKIRNSAYSPSSLRRLDLPNDVTPDSSTERAMRWTNLAGLREIIVFPDGNGDINYFYIKAKTP